jgi:hypothetical protein
MRKLTKAEINRERPDFSKSDGFGFSTRHRLKALVHKVYSVFSWKKVTGLPRNLILFHRAFYSCRANNGTTRHYPSLVVTVLRQSQAYQRLRQVVGCGDGFGSTKQRFERKQPLFVGGNSQPAQLAVLDNRE